MKKSDYHTGFVYLLEILYKSKANFNGSSWVIVGEKHPQPQCLC